APVWNHISSEETGKGDLEDGTGDDRGHWSENNSETSAAFPLGKKNPECQSGGTESGGKRQTGVNDHRLVQRIRLVFPEVVFVIENFLLDPARFVHLVFPLRIRFDRKSFRVGLFDYVTSE